MAGFDFHCRKCKAHLRLKTFQPGAKFICPACKTVNVLESRPAGSKPREAQNPFDDDWQPAPARARSDDDFGEEATLDTPTLWAGGITGTGLIGLLLPFLLRSAGMFSAMGMAVALVIAGMVFVGGVLMLTVMLGNKYGGLAILGTLGGGALVMVSIVVVSLATLADELQVQQPRQVATAPEKPARPARPPARKPQNVQSPVEDPNRQNPGNAPIAQNPAGQNAPPVSMTGYPYPPPPSLDFPYVPQKTCTITLPVSVGMEKCGMLTDALLADPSIQLVICFQAEDKMHFMAGPVNSVTQVTNRVPFGMPYQSHEEKLTIEAETINWQMPPAQISTYWNHPVSGITVGSFVRMQNPSRTHPIGMNPQPITSGMPRGRNEIYSQIPKKKIIEAFDALTWNTFPQYKPAAYIVLKDMDLMEVSEYRKRVVDATGISRVMPRRDSGYRFLEIGPVPDFEAFAKQLESFEVASVDAQRRLIILKSAQESEDKMTAAAPATP